MNNPKYITKALIFFLLTGIALYACKKRHTISPYFSDKEENPIIKPGNQNTGDIPETIKRIKFQLGNYSGTIINFEDSIRKTFDILSGVFSSKEFKDSLLKYTFVCTNGSTSSCLTNKPSLHAKKCDNVLGLIKGGTVYDDLTADSIVTLNIEIKSSTGSSSFGFTSVCNSKITSYDWFLKGGRSLPTTTEYAIHLAHEFTHTVGYVHSTHPKAGDVAYSIGGIVRNILIRKSNLSATAGIELTSVLGTGVFNYMRIRVPDLPGLSEPFLQAYREVETGFASTTQKISYLYLQFLPDNKVKLGLRAVNANSTYFIVTFDFDLLINDDGIGNFTYLNITNANSTNQQRVKPIIDYLTSGAFSISFMNQPAPSSSIVGGCMSIDNPTSFFYGVMLEKL